MRPRRRLEEQRLPASTRRSAEQPTHPTHTHSAGARFEGWPSGAPWCRAGLPPWRGGRPRQVAPRQLRAARRRPRGWRARRQPRLELFAAPEDEPARLSEEDGEGRAAQHEHARRASVLAEDVHEEGELEQQLERVRVRLLPVVVKKVAAAAAAARGPRTSAYHRRLRGGGRVHSRRCRGRHGRTVVHTASWHERGVGVSGHDWLREDKGLPAPLAHDQLVALPVHHAHHRHARHHRGVRHHRLLHHRLLHHRDGARSERVGRLIGRRRRGG
eukprot:scaffold97144_cov49-Phaeocystis_antarctica.AAC.1